METRDMRALKAGFVGFGEVNTPREFIEPRCAAAAGWLKARGVDLTVADPVSDDPDGAQAARAAKQLAAGEWDVLIVCIAGWIPSWAVLRTIQDFRHKPMVLWGLSGWQDGGRFVTTADQAGSTALRQPLAELGYTLTYVVGRMNEPPPVDQVVTAIRAGAAAAALRRATIGMAGYADMRLYGTRYDAVSLKRDIGPEVEHFELLEAAQGMEAIPAAEVEPLAAAVRTRWRFTREPAPGTVEQSVRLFFAFRRIIESRGYAAFSYNDVDGVKRLLHFAPAGALTLLHDELGIPSVPENDVLGSVTQLIMHLLTGQIAAYLEFYEFTRNGALMGVPDYVPSEIVDGPVTVMPNAFGSFGEGLLNVSRLKTGPVTLARLCQVNGRYRLHALLAEAETPPAWEEAGWAPPAPQLPSLHIRLAAPEAFLQQVMGQHYILTYGDQLPLVKALCSVLGIEQF